MRPSARSAVSTRRRTTHRVPLLGADGFTARWNQRHLLARRAGRARAADGAPAAAVRIRGRCPDRRPSSDARSWPDRCRVRTDYLRAEVWFAVAYEDATQLR